MSVIGITLGYYHKDDYWLAIHKNYIKVIEKAGGVPVLLPPVINQNGLEQLKGILSGIVLTGGCDVDPIYFDEEPRPELRRIDPERDFFEIELCKWSLDKGLPIMAICRGIQILNIACGGTIIQHLGKDYYKHYQEAPRWYSSHKIVFTGDNKLRKIFGQDEIRVNSFHHQAVGDTGEGLKVTARSTDGIIEGIEMTDNTFVQGVQWHPEAMYIKDRMQMKLFQEFVNESKKY